MVLNEPRRSVSVRALRSGGRFLPPWLARLIPNRAMRVASGLPRSARKAGTCSVGATFGLYSKLIRERASVRGISLHSLRPRMRLHIGADLGLRGARRKARAAPEPGIRAATAQLNRRALDQGVFTLKDAGLR